MNCALFYSYKNFKDTLFIIFDHDKKVTSYKRNKDVCAIYHDDEIIGYNIFHVNQYIKIMLNGIVVSIPKVVCEMINDMIVNSGFSKLIERNKNSFKIVKIISSKSIRINNQIIEISLPNNVEISKYAVFSTKNDILLDLSVSKDNHLLSEKELNISNSENIYYLDENEVENQDYFLIEGEKKDE
ncbi:MAG: DUF4479 domain-containing protein [Bacilli bacterium]